MSLRLEDLLAAREVLEKKLKLVVGLIALETATKPNYASFVNDVSHGSIRRRIRRSRIPTLNGRSGTVEGNAPGLTKDVVRVLGNAKEPVKAAYIREILLPKYPHLEPRKLSKKISCILVNKQRQGNASSKKGSYFLLKQGMEEYASLD